MQEEGGYRKTAGNVFVRHTSVPPSDVHLANPSDTRHGRHQSGTSSLPSYHSPTLSSHGLHAYEVQGPWAILGERLNLEKDEVRALIANNAAMHEADEEAEGRAYEMPYARADGRD
ncbi:hypothetical protein NliqN6_1306 [Naganishia liquefaciens]|uniref:Uncharacterized protein n=1 Tax=Naganishia liquefaciens TaxID=104408 RepID=A0A8H3TRG1_9TREE|nr:hypothetical protein NliqN6_1306 [Naganishia liquefaciens]